MTRFLVSSLLAALFAGASFAAGMPTTVAEVRQMFRIPGDAKVVYKSEDGTVLTEPQFAALLPKGASVSLDKDEKSGVYTLAFAKPGAFRRPAPVVSLPPIDFTDLAGKPVRDADLRGKPTLVSFHFAACAPCIREVPALNAFRRQHPEYNYVAFTFDDTKTARDFLAKHPLEWPVVANAKKFVDSAGVASYPTLLLVSAEGGVLGMENGFDTRQGEAAGVAALENKIAAMAAARPWEPLLDSKLSKFDIWLSYHGSVIRSVLDGTAPKSLKPVGLNPPKQNVFSVSEQAGKPVLRITGEWYGCLNTKQSFSNFHFVAQVRWGEKKWEPRLDEPRDSGILYHSRGPFGVDYWKSWALSQEFQVIEHGHGEYWSQATSAIDIRVHPKKPGEEAPRWHPDAPWTAFGSANPGNNHALAGSDEDKPGEWNTLELVCMQDNCVHVVNGKVVMALANSRYALGERVMPMTGGTLQIQSEAAEVFYRNVAIRPIREFSKEFAAYFPE
jgi:peroxiredoxin